jgi:hypothetical protein
MSNEETRRNMAKREPATLEQAIAAYDRAVAAFAIKPRRSPIEHKMGALYNTFSCLLGQRRVDGPSYPREAAQRLFRNWFVRRAARRAGSWPPSGRAYRSPR